MLCDLCEAACTLEKSSTGLATSIHHTGPEDLNRSKDDGCQICFRLWNSLANQQIKIAFSPDQAPYWKSGDRFENYNIDDYYGIRAMRDGQKFLFKCRNIRGGYATLLSLDLDLKITSYVNVSSDRTSTTTASEQSLDMIRRWLDDCTDKHDKCSSGRSKDPALPTRLVQIRPYLRLVTTNSLPSSTLYVALSHCWGLDPIFTLKESVVDDLHKSIPAENLPRNFLDAISITSKLGVDYIWIDSLCIIQDSKEDWLHEASRMQEVYSHCWLNLAATGFPDGSKGIFGQRDASSFLGYIERPGEYNLVDTLQWLVEVEKAPLNMRAWVLQERLLSPRTIHFGTAQVFWDCREQPHSETFPKTMPVQTKVPSYASSNNLTIKGRVWGPYGSGDKSSYLNTWCNIVQSYNELRLTKEEDRLVALSGIAHFMESKVGGEYFAGLWKTSLLEFTQQLCWVVELQYGRRVYNESYLGEVMEPSRRRPVYCGPTWSWVSVSGAPLFNKPGYTPLIEVLEIDVSLLGSDPMGPLRNASLRIKALLVKALIHWTQDERQWPDESVRLDVEINGTKMTGFLTPDACMYDSPLIDLGPAPLDVDSPYVPASSQKGLNVSSQAKQTMEAYLIAMLDSHGFTDCLLLRPTGRQADEFQRIGFLTLFARSEIFEDKKVVKLV
jgi:hypothetical protein